MTVLLVVSFSVMEAQGEELMGVHAPPRGHEGVPCSLQILTYATLYDARIVENQIKASRPVAESKALLLERGIRTLLRRDASTFLSHRTHYAAHNIEKTYHKKRNGSPSKFCNNNPTMLDLIKGAEQILAAGAQMKSETYEFFSAKEPSEACHVFLKTAFRKAVGMYMRSERDGSTLETWKQRSGMMAAWK
jgi:hypothetical protein